MKRATITLPESLARIADREVRRRGVSLSALVREALSVHLAVVRRTPRRLPFVAIGASGHRTTARDLEAILEGEWAEHRHR